MHVKTLSVGLLVAALAALAVLAWGFVSQWCVPVPGFTVGHSTVALWHLDEGSGQTAVDASPNGYDLQLGPTPGVEPRDPAWVDPGRFGGCLGFQTSLHNYAVVPQSITLPTAQISIELWLRTTVQTGRLFEMEPEICRLAWHGAGLGFIIVDGSSTYAAQVIDPTVLASLTDGAWHYVAATYDGTTMRMYVDGQQHGHLPVSPALATGTAMVVGGRSGGSDTVDGEIDEIRISARAITAAEISDYWASTLP